MKRFLALALFASWLSACSLLEDVDVYRPVKPGALPPEILAYVEDNYPGAEIRRARRDDDGYELELSNGLELNFLLDGTFLSAEPD